MAVNWPQTVLLPPERVLSSDWRRVDVGVRTGSAVLYNVGSKQIVSLLIDPGYTLELSLCLRARCDPHLIVNCASLEEAEANAVQLLERAGFQGFETLKARVEGRLTVDFARALAARDEWLSVAGELEL